MLPSVYVFAFWRTIIYPISCLVTQAFYPIHVHVVEVPAQNARCLRTDRVSIDDAERVAREDLVLPSIKLLTDVISHQIENVVHPMAPVSRATIIATIAGVVVPQVDVHIVVTLVAPGREVDLVKC
jgi:hypothetical protein